MIWRTDDPGVPLPQRVIYDKELIPVVLTKATDLGKSEFLTSWKKAVEEFVTFLHELLIGPPQPAYLPLDRQFIARLESLLDFPIDFTATALGERIARDTRFRRRTELWMRDRQGWLISPATMPDNIDRASRFTCYVLVNRLCFYNALRRKFPSLERIKIGNTIDSAQKLKAKLVGSFDRAMRHTGDYDTVFEPDAGDEFPFLSDEVVPEWRSLIQSLDDYDFATIDLEIIGAMYERLISPEERHRYGQHYTQPAVVDLINAFSINNGADTVLDPACGGGTFLVRAYDRKKQLDNTQDHTALLASLYGCDLLRYACHLSVINLAVRDLIDDENYPRIHRGDFLDLVSDSIFAQLPTRITAGGLPTGMRELCLAVGQFDAVVGNPPYIQARQIQADRRAAYLELVRQEWPHYEWNNGSDILVWFFTHSAQFLKPSGHLSLLTQAAWLDVEYGVALQHWMLDNFRVVAVLETEAEPWFTDARVATAVTVLARERDETLRNDNLIRFVQFRSPLQHVHSGTAEATRQKVAEDLRDTILRCRTDMSDESCRVRVVRQADLHQLGIGDGDRYVGSKWGRYLRALDSLYKLQSDQSAAFCALDDLAHIFRGSTTNCDDFFIVNDITSEALNKIHSPSSFKNTYAVRRSDVSAGVYKIVRRDDGVELPLERAQLVPILKTARDVTQRCTSAIDNTAFAVTIPAGARSALSRVTKDYIAAGEREHWHESASFSGRTDWYVLRDTDLAPILFVKTIQYAPQLLWNDANLLANQRLYNVEPRTGVDAETLGAVLNSTVFAAERFAGVKALGREAANDVEVFTARQFKVPDIRTLPKVEQRKLREAVRRLRRRNVTPLLEETLLEAGLHEARVYTDQHPVSDAVWPAELTDPDRQQIDSIILIGLGMSEADADCTRTRLYNELITFTRSARLLELEAQVNRRGRTNAGPAAADLADDLWADLTSNNKATVRTIPDDFLPETGQTMVVTLPAGRVTTVEPDLFSDPNTFSLRFGRDVCVDFNSAQQRDLALVLAENRARGDILLPRAIARCGIMAEEIREYLAELKQKLEDGAAEITDNSDLRARIIAEAMKRILPHNR